MSAARVLRALGCSFAAAAVLATGACGTSSPDAPGADGGTGGASDAGGGGARDGGPPGTTGGGSGDGGSAIADAAAGAGALTITTTELPAGAMGTAYLASLAAAGGHAPYTWSLTQGALPAGIVLAASGALTGSPTTVGSSPFTAQVTDGSSPPLTATRPLTITVATIWYVRPDGGSRYSAAATDGQCDGRADVAYPGSGTDQHCAFADYRYLYSDKSYASSAWVIAGGDTVILRGGPWRVGSDTPGSVPGGDFCAGIGPYCSSPPIPSGTAALPTRILGENYASCGSKTQIFGSHGAGAIFTLNGASFVDLECLELTDHAQCSQTGTPQLPSSCTYGVDDYASNGITTDVGTHDLNLQDLDLHGFTSRAIIGPIGGEVDVSRVRLAYNGNAGWDFDDGNATPSVNGNVKASYLTIEWNGCNEEYPVTHTNSAISCYDQDSGGYGDGLGTPPTPLDFSCDHCQADYNTQDGMDLGHTQQSTISFTNSLMYGNMGGTYKIGPNYQMTLINDLSLGNCQRMSAPIGDVPASFNANLSLFCRADDQMGANFWADASAADSVLDYEFNTFVGYEATTIDVQCSASDCPNVDYTFRNNLVIGYANPQYDDGKDPGMFYNIYPTAEDHNLFYNLRSVQCPTAHAGEICVDPLLTGEPTFVNEASLDGFDFVPTATSPVKRAGVAVPAITTDRTGAPRSDPPTIGAYE